MYYYILYIVVLYLVPVYLLPGLSRATIYSVYPAHIYNILCYDILWYIYVHILYLVYPISCTRFMLPHDISCTDIWCVLVHLYSRINIYDNPTRTRFLVVFNTRWCNCIGHVLKTSRCNFGVFYFYISYRSMYFATISCVSALFCLIFVQNKQISV